MRRSRVLAGLTLASLLASCGPREPADAARGRAEEAALHLQIADLRDFVARAEGSALETTGRVAIGVREDVASSLLNVSLPQDKTVAGIVRVRLDSARPSFRGNQASIVGEGEIQLLGMKAAPIELSGHLADLRVDSGKLAGRFEIDHFEIENPEAHRLARTVLAPLVRRNLDTLNSLLPVLEIPVQLEESIAIAGLDEGVVTTRAGTLPLRMTVTQTVPIRERLWVMIDVQAGPWRTADAAEPVP